jgi:thioredoxin-related protein
VRGAVALAAVLLSSSAEAAELLMVERKGCNWCETFDKEIAPGYAKTEEGKLAPLRRQDLHKPWPDGFELREGARFTPTFILIDDGKEVGRFVGYPGSEFFYPALAELLKKLPEKKQ